MRRLTATLLLLLAAPVLAAPAIESLEVEVRRQRQLRVTAEVRVDEPGAIRLTGDVSGVPVAEEKPLRRAGARRLRLKVDARTLGLRAPEGPLVFSLVLAVEEEGGATVTRAIERTVPVPLVLLPGLGNELTPGTLEPLAAALDAAAEGAWARDGKRPALAVHGYESLSTPLDRLGRDAGKVIRKLAKRSPFSRADVVGYSMGGLVARSACREGAGRYVRKLVFLGTPNEGTPLAWLGGAAVSLGFSGQVPGLDGELAQSLLDPDATEVIRTFYPTYQWYPPGQEILLLLLPDRTAPLAEWNAAGPPPGIEFHAVSYSSGATLETMDLSAALPLLTGGVPDPTDLAGLIDTLSTGTGDGVVPLRSVFLSDEPTWTGGVTTWDMGPGTHAGLPLDPAVVARIAEILSE